MRPSCPPHSLPLSLCCVAIICHNNAKCLGVERRACDVIPGSTSGGNSSAYIHRDLFNCLNTCRFHNTRTLNYLYKFRHHEEDVLRAPSTAQNWARRRRPRSWHRHDRARDSSATSRRVSLTVDNVGTGIRRPITKPRPHSSLRTSSGPVAINGDEDDDASSGVVTPKRGAVSRLAIHRNASKRTSLLAQTLPRRASPDPNDDDRPDYSADSLRQLKDSTPSTPRDLSTPVPPQTLDLSSKFGSSLARYEATAASSSAIPSAAEIAEKKSRRARLAKEQAAEEYISLDPDDPGLDADRDEDDDVTRDERGRLVLAPKDKYGQAESRLVRDDEDVLENFDEFTDDGRIALGPAAEAQAQRTRHAEIAAQIAAAEASEESDDSRAGERERNAAFEAAQTRHGTYHAAAHATSDDPYEHLRPRTPPQIAPLPTLEGVLERLRRQLAEMQAERGTKLAAMAALQREKIRLGEEEVRIQQALRDTAEKFRALRAEKGIAVADDDDVGAQPKPGLLEAPAAGDDVPAHDPVDERLPAPHEQDAAASTSGFGAGWSVGVPAAGLRGHVTGMSGIHAEDSDDY
nr:hypothetical protein CFP56_50362 [Quercus suber]